MMLSPFAFNAEIVARKKGWNLPRIRKENEGVFTDFARQENPWYGVLFHTTGSGVLELAKNRSWSTVDAALWTYGQEWSSCPHYLNDESGQLWLITSEDLIAPHCGVKGWMRSAMLDGSWIEHVSSVGLERWRARWPGVKSPQHLFPSLSGNHAYLGVENIPQPDGTFTDRQYASLAKLVADFDVRHSIGILHSIASTTRPVGPPIDVNGVSRTHRLVGHEDVNPFNTSDGGRWDKKGGWDPGALRIEPKFHWEKVLLP